MPLNKRLSFAFSNKNVKTNCETTHILEDGLKTIKDRMKILEDKQRMVPLFKPSKTSLSAIQFLNYESIEQLKKCDEPLIKNIFKILNIVVNNLDESDSLITNFLNSNKLICKI
jgi:hypothetical protein